jgi:anti-sigma factor RsiW
MIPAKYTHIAFGFFLSLIMSGLISGVSTVSALGVAALFSGIWIKAWASSWIVAFPSVLVVAPIARGIVGRLVKPPV